MSCDTVALYKITIFVIYFLENTPQIWHKSSQGFIHNICTFQLALESYIQCSIVPWAGLPLVTSLVMMLTKSYSGWWRVLTWDSGTNSNLCRKLWKNSQRRLHSRKEREPHYCCKFSLSDISPSILRMSNPVIDKCWEYFLQKVKCIMQMCAAVCDRQTAPLNMVT